jgi:capsular polysaccharide transport system permease protein
MAGPQGNGAGERVAVRVGVRRRFPGVRSISALMLREMATTYGRSPGGYIWALLDPIAAVALLSIVFSIAFAKPPIGNNFALFYATGYLPYMLYFDVSQKLGVAVRFNKPLLAYPSVSYIDALASRFLLNVATHLMVFLIVMSGLAWFYDLTLILNHAAIANALLMASALALGVGTLNCYLLSAFPLWERLWAIINRPLFIMSGVLFLVDHVPEPFRFFLMLNPIAHVIAEMRVGFFVTYDATFVSPTYVYLWSAVTLFFGLLLLHRYHKDILNDGA